MGQWKIWGGWGGDLNSSASQKKTDIWKKETLYYKGVYLMIIKDFSLYK